MKSVGGGEVYTSNTVIANGVVAIENGTIQPVDSWSSLEIAPGAEAIDLHIHGLHGAYWCTPL